MNTGKFVVKKITSFKSLLEKETEELPQSDLVFQNEDVIVQFQYVEEGETKPPKYIVKPGFFNLGQDNTGVKTQEIELRKRDLLDDITSTKSILNEAKVFFSRLHIYEQLKQPPKRAVLLYSTPGLGKSASIEKACQDFVAEDPGTVVLVWPTSKIEADAVLDFFSTRVEYSAECTRLILIMEDIGGREPGDYRGAPAVDAGLLNLLDGIGMTFKLPTFIVATTNHPESLLQSLADRPGRFDLMLKLSPPSYEEKVRLLSFIAKRDLTDDEKESIGIKGTEDFSIAHLQEIVIRSMLHDKPFSQVIRELNDHRKLFDKAFEERGSMGFN